MKKIIIILGFLMPLIVEAQQVTEGMVQYLVTHNWTKKMASLTYITPQQKAKQAYMWGNRSEWKMYMNLYFSPTETKYEDSEEKAERDAEGGYDWRKETFFIKRNFEKNVIQEAYELLGKTYIVEDTLLAVISIAPSLMSISNIIPGKLWKCSGPAFKRISWANHATICCFLTVSSINAFMQIWPATSFKSF